MSHLVFTWELGAGYGHLVPFQPIAGRLIDAGHQVTVIARDLSKAAVALAGLDIRLFQAPVKLSRPQKHIAAPTTFAQLLLNMGYENQGELGAMIEAWRNIFLTVRPDFLLFDHSPTAILAARGMGLPQMTIGPGFFCPVDEFPLREMAPWRRQPKKERVEEELAIIARINDCLKKNRQPIIQRVGQIYSDLTDNLLTTFRELDHFPKRPSGNYLGTWSAINGCADTPSAEDLWPPGSGPKVYAYLNRCDGTIEIIRWLNAQGMPALVVSENLTSDLLAAPQSPTLRFSRTHLPLESIRNSCDVAILNANHGTCCQFLLAGRPILQIPMTFEQMVLTRRTVDLGAATWAPPDQPHEVVSQLRSILDNHSYRVAAHNFAKKYEAFHPDLAVTNCTNQIARYLYEPEVTTRI